MLTRFHQFASNSQCRDSSMSVIDATDGRKFHGFSSSKVTGTRKFSKIVRLEKAKANVSGENDSNDEWRNCHSR